MSDPVVEAMQYAIARLCVELDAHGWDQNPTLWVVTRVMVPDEASFILEFEQVAGQDVFETLDIPPGDVLDVLADLAEKSEDSIPDSAFAFVFASEAYVSTNFEHPERREARVLGAVDRGGFGYGHLHFRDTEEVRMEVDRPGENSLALSGYVYQSLRRLIEASPAPTSWT